MYLEQEGMGSEAGKLNWDFRGMETGDFGRVLSKSWNGIFPWYVWEEQSKNPPCGTKGNHEIGLL